MIKSGFKLMLLSSCVQLLQMSINGFSTSSWNHIHFVGVRKSSWWSRNSFIKLCDYDEYLLWIYYGKSYKLRIVRYRIPQCRFRQVICFLTHLLPVPCWAGDNTDLHSNSNISKTVRASTAFNRIFKDRS